MIQFKKLRWKNFLSTGDSFIEINLDEYPTSLVIGENGSGKSTMLDALTFSLFSKPFRKVNKTQMINTVNAKGCLAEIEFDIGNKSYMIRRTYLKFMSMVNCSIRMLKSRTIRIVLKSRY